MEINWTIFLWTSLSFVLLVLMVSVTIWIILRLKSIGKPPDVPDDEEFKDF